MSVATVAFNNEPKLKLSVTGRAYNELIYTKEQQACRPVLQCKCCTCRWTLDPRQRHTVWNLTIGFMFYWLGFSSLAQAAVQRFSATKTLHHARLWAITAYFMTYVLLLSCHSVCSVRPIAACNLTTVKRRLKRVWCLFITRAEHTVDHDHEISIRFNTVLPCHISVNSTSMSIKPRYTCTIHSRPWRNVAYSCYIYGPFCQSRLYSNELYWLDPTQQGASIFLQNPGLPHQMAWYNVKPWLRVE